MILISANAYSSEKIITVDIDYIINTSKAGIYIQDQLKGKNDNRVKKLEIKNKELSNKEKNTYQIWKQTEAEINISENDLSSLQYIKMVILFMVIKYFKG